MTGNTFSRDELIAAFDVFEQTVDRAAQTRDWDPWTDHYTEDVPSPDGERRYGYVAHVRDRDAAARLWTVSEAMLAQAGF